MPTIGRSTHNYIPITRLEKMVFFELATAFLLSVCGMTFITLVGGAYGPIRDGLPLDAILRFIPSLIPYMLPWTIPTAFVAACIMTYGRMANSNELTAIRASGVHIWRVLTPAALMAVVFCAICAYLNHQIVPQTGFYQYGLSKSSKPSQIMAALESTDPMIEIGDVSLYVAELLPDNKMRDVVLVHKNKSGTQNRLEYVVAPAGQYEYTDVPPQIIFHLYADRTADRSKNPYAGKVANFVSNYSKTPNDFEQAFSNRIDWPKTLESMEDIKFLPQKGGHMTTSELLFRTGIRERQIKGPSPYQIQPDMPAAQQERLKKLQARWESEPRRWQVEIQNRMALSFAALVLGMVAIPLGVLARRGKPLLGFGIAIAIVLGVYYPLMAGGSALGNSGALPPLIAAWITNLVVGGIGLVLLGSMLKR